MSDEDVMGETRFLSAAALLARNMCLTSEHGDKALYATSHHVSDALIQSVANLAADNGGNVLGLTFDVEEARAVLAFASDCKAVIDSTRSFAQRLKDHVLLRRKATAERAGAVYGSLARLVRTPEGKHLVQAFEQMHAEVTRGRSRRARKSTAKAAPKPAANAASTTTGTTTAQAAPPAGTVTH